MSLIFLIEYVSHNTKVRGRVELLIAHSIGIANRALKMVDERYKADLAQRLLLDPASI